MTNRYEVTLEVAGPLAMFTRPDTGGTPTSFSVPTWSAAKGMLEAIAWFKGGEAWIDPVRVQICRRVGESGGRVRYQRYTTNYGGPERKQNQLSKGTSFQLFATVLSDVCYRVHGVIRSSEDGARDHCNPRHYLQDLFNRRLRQGRCHRTPCLGWAEFTATYWGPFRDGHDGRPLVTEPDTDLNVRVSSLLRSVFDRPVHGRYAPRFDHHLEVKQGLLDFEGPVDAHAD